MTTPCASSKRSREAAQHQDGVLDRRLLDLHRLEAPLEGRVLLEVFLVLGPGGGGDGAQLAAREGRLEQVGRVAAALRAAGADDGVRLVDEEDDGLRRRLHLGDDALRRFSNSPFTPAPAWSAPRSSVEDVHVLELLGDVALGDAHAPAPRRAPSCRRPASPTMMGLFLRRRARMSTTCRISGSRPKTGSSSPSRARWVRSVVKRASGPLGRAERVASPWPAFRRPCRRAPPTPATGRRRDGANRAASPLAGGDRRAGSCAASSRGNPLEHGSSNGQVAARRHRRGARAARPSAPWPRRAPSKRRARRPGSSSKRSVPKSACLRCRSADRPRSAGAPSAGARIDLVMLEDPCTSLSRSSSNASKHVLDRDLVVTRCDAGARRRLERASARGVQRLQERAGFCDEHGDLEVSLRSIPPVLVRRDGSRGGGAP